MKPIQHALQMPVIGLSAGGAGRSNWYKGNTHTHTFWSDGKEFPETAAVMWWRGKQGRAGTEIARTAAREGHDVVVASNGHLYFDYYQSRDKDHEPLAIGGFLPLETVYHFDPVIEGLSEQDSKRILGAQGQLWREYMPTTRQVEYMAFPRACALAELVWSPQYKKHYASFLDRLQVQERRWDAAGIHYRPAETP